MYKLNPWGSGQTETISRKNTADLCKVKSM